MESFLHGIEIVEVDNGIRPVTTVKSSVIMAWGTAPDADETVFPLNEPVLLLSSPRKAASLGEAGTLKHVVDDIYDQDAAAVIVCRVKEEKIVTSVAGGSNTGNGTLTLASPAWGAGVKDGNYEIVCSTAATNGGTFNVIDPIGTVIGQVAVGVAFTGAVKFTIADGSTDFAVGDKFTVSVVMDLSGTWSNMLGDVAAKTGIWAALSARAKVHLTPRLLCAPGFSGQRVEGAVTSISLPSGGGTGHTVAPQVHIYPADATKSVERTPDPANVGNGVMTLATPAYATVVAPGDWSVECVTAATDGGSFVVKDPGGAIVGNVDVGVAYDGPIKFTIADGATDFAVGDKFKVAVAITGGTGVAATAEATVVAGALTGVAVKRSGFDYTAAPIVAFSGGGTGAVTHPLATAVIGDAANPIVAELLGPADRLRSIIVADGPNSTDEDAVTYREDWGSKRVYVVDPQVLVWDTQLDSAVSRPASGRVCGMISRMDREKGFWWSPSNQEMYGVIGTARPIDFNISDPNSQANYLNENEVATIVRHEGFRLWGNRTTSTDPLWAFLAVRRTADMIYESIEASFLWAVDRPLTQNNILEIAESVNAYLRHLKAVGAIIGGQAWLDPELNTAAELQAGKLRVSFDIEPPAPLEHLIFHAYRNGTYYEEVIERVIRELAN